MATYYDRLRDCGLSEDDAAVIIDDFIHDGDICGLAEYVAFLEKLKKDVGALQS